MQNLLEWLLAGDPAIIYQTKRDLLKTPLEVLNRLQAEIALDGWGKTLLEKRNPETGLWGNGIYAPKWICTHYTLLQLKDMALEPSNVHYKEGCRILLNKLWFNRGLIRKNHYQDFCISAMILSMCSYARIESQKLKEIVDYLLEHHFDDGGWNCRWNRGAVHSSVHTTLTTLECIRDYKSNGYSYRLTELEQQAEAGREFLLHHHLFKSHRTGRIMNKQFIMLSYPARWKYDILRALDYFQAIHHPYDKRMDDALEILLCKQRKNKRWPVQHKHQGLVHFDMEKTGSDSRWNTLRALRVLKHLRPQNYPYDT